MKFFIQISVFIIALQWCDEVKCKPHFGRKHFVKTFHFGLVPLPPHHVSVSLEKITPFGAFTLQHHINKRQAAEAEVYPESNEVQVLEGVETKELSIEEVPKVEKAEIAESKSGAEVIITSVVEPIESGKQISFLLPVDSEVIITPAKKEVEETVLISSEISTNVESESVVEEIIPPPEAVVEITPKPVEIPPPPELKPVVPNVVISTPIESTVPPVFSIPTFQNTNTPMISPIFNNIPNTPFLYTDINRIPFYTRPNFYPFITPATVPFPGILVPPSPPPPVKEAPPVVKEETPNFFVKSSRFVIQFGTMMLQMLSQFVNGRGGLNQIPVLPPIPGAK